MHNLYKKLKKIFWSHEEINYNNLNIILRCKYFFLKYKYISIIKINKKYNILYYYKKKSKK